jgi:hypothetical protein
MQCPSQTGKPKPTSPLRANLIHSDSLLPLPAMECRGQSPRKTTTRSLRRIFEATGTTPQFCHPAFSIMPDLASLPPRSPFPFPPRPPPRPPLPLPREEPPGPPPPPPPPRFPPPPRRLTEKLMRISGFSTHSTPFKPSLSFSSSAIRQAWNTPIKLSGLG